MPKEYARAVHELVRAKVEQRAPEVQIETEKREAPKVVNIMDALRKSMEARGQTRFGTQFASEWVKSPHLKIWLGHKRVPSRQRALDGRCIRGWASSSPTASGGVRSADRSRCSCVD
jgi:hypothetical protein